MEAVCLGLFMVSAFAFGTLLEHPASLLHQTIPNAMLRRFLMGLAMGGTAIAIIYSPWGKQSGGHLNPAMTFAFFRLGKLYFWDAVFYGVAQFTGAIIAAYALKLLFPSEVQAITRLGGQSIASSVTLLQAVVLEAIATFFLVFVVFGTAVDPRAPKVGGFAIGLTIAADILAIGPLTGASMNPARSFGPAVVTGIFEGQTAFWVGPLVGGIVAALLYDKLFIGRQEPSPLPAQ